MLSKWTSDVAHLRLLLWIFVLISFLYFHFRTACLVFTLLDVLLLVILEISEAEIVNGCGILRLISHHSLLYLWWLRTWLSLLATFFSWYRSSTRHAVLRLIQLRHLRALLMNTLLLMLCQFRSRMDVTLFSLVVLFKLLLLLSFIWLVYFLIKDFWRLLAMLLLLLPCVLFVALWIIAPYFVSIGTSSIVCGISLRAAWPIFLHWLHHLYISRLQVFLLPFQMLCDDFFIRCQLIWRILLLMLSRILIYNVLCGWFSQLVWVLLFNVLIIVIVTVVVVFTLGEVLRAASGLGIYNVAGVICAPRLLILLITIALGLMCVLLLFALILTTYVRFMVQLLCGALFVRRVILVFTSVPYSVGVCVLLAGV